MPATLVELSKDCLTRTIRFDLAVVEAMMLWPEDEKARERWLHAAMVREASALGEDLPESHARFSLQLAADTTPLKELKGIAEDRQAHGWVAGAMLHRAVERAAVEGSVNLGKIAQEVVQASAGLRRQHGMRLSVKTINNRIWPDYRSVAHFWAAYVTALDEGQKAFPCSIGGLPAFLATAEAYRKAGETVQTKQGPVMRPGESVLVPDFLTLPTLALEFAARA
jgi:hypothetical protein